MGASAAVESEIKYELRQYNKERLDCLRYLEHHAALEQITVLEFYEKYQDDYFRNPYHEHWLKQDTDTHPLIFLLERV